MIRSRVRPVAFRVVVILAGKDGAVDVGLVIRAVVCADVFATVVDVFLAVVVRRFGNRNSIGRIGGDAEAIVVGLYGAVGGERTGRVDAALSRIVGADVESLPGDALRWRMINVGEHLAGVRFVVFVAPLAADAIRNAGEREKVAFVGGIDERRAANGDRVRIFPRSQGHALNQPAIFCRPTPDNDRAAA